MTENEISWDLSEIYKGTEDPKIEESIKNLKLVVEDFVKNYKGKIQAPEFTASNLLELFRKTEEFEAALDEILLFSSLLFAANMKISESEALKSKVERIATEMGKSLAFLDLEIGKYVHENEDLINDPILDNYKHHLETIRRRYPHLLSEVEEQLILEKDENGIRQWSQLQGKWLNTKEFKVNVEGEEKILSYGEANSLLRHRDRDTRISAEKSIYSTLGKDETIFSTALRNICEDWVKTVKRRNFNSPLHDSLIVNDTTREIIDSLMSTVEKNAGVYRRYLKLKAKLLGLPKLNYADVLAPLPDVPEMKFTWEESKELIMEAYRQFDEEFVNTANDMFERKHIDGAIRMGKRNGAFCTAWYKGKSAYILLSFAGQLGEVYTLAHELGHAIHDYLASREQTLLNLHPGYTVAETASIFGELLMTDLLLDKAESVLEKKAILAHVLDDAGMAAFQVSARYWFEEAMYDAIRRNEFLDGQTICKYWVEGRDKIYGDSTEFFDELIWEWTMKPHYFRPNFRFYNYPYVYAQLFNYALYQKYKEEGKAFVPKFKKLLSSGGSLSAEDLGKIVGLDITKPEFWELGIKQYEDFVNRLEELIEN